MIKNILKSSILITILAGTGCSTSVNGTGSSNNQASVSVTNNKLGECANEVAKISLTKTANNASLKVDAITPQSFTHNFKVITIDLNNFSSGGKLTIKGTTGSQGGTSFAILAAETPFKCTGYQDGDLASASNVGANKTFELTYNFSSGQTLKFFAEGSWGGVKDTINNVDLNISAN